MLKNCTIYGAALFTCFLNTQYALADSGNYFYTSEPQTQNTQGYDAYNSFELQAPRANPEKDEDEYRFARNGNDYFIYTGYIFSYHFNKSAYQKFLDAGINNNYFVSPKNSSPDSFHGFEVGFGKQWGKHVDFKFSYIQDISRTRKSGIESAAIPTQQPSPPAIANSKVKINMQGVQFEVSYILNPDDQIQIGTTAGFSIERVEESVTIPSVTLLNPTKLTTEINPNAGLEIIFMFTPNIAVNVATQYRFHTTSDISSGQVDAIAGMTFIL